eukprot:scaffold142255_cov30-Tisochrysis_lutea.AAC.6
MPPSRRPAGQSQARSRSLSALRPRGVRALPRRRQCSGLGRVRDGRTSRLTARRADEIRSARPRVRAARPPRRRAPGPAHHATPGRAARR